MDFRGLYDSLQLRRQQPGIRQPMPFEGGMAGVYKNALGQFPFQLGGQPFEGGFGGAPKQPGFGQPFGQPSPFQGFGGKPSFPGFGGEPYGGFGGSAKPQSPMQPFGGEKQSGKSFGQQPWGGLQNSLSGFAGLPGMRSGPKRQKY